MSKALLWRRAGLAASLVGVLYAAWTAPPASDPVVSPVERAGKAAMPAAAGDSAAQADSGASDLHAGSQRSAQDDDTPWCQPFVVPAWAQPRETRASDMPPPPPVQEVVVEEVAPSGPPPLPFKALGRYEDERGPVALLQHFDQSLIARPGDKVGDAYLLEAIRDQMAVFMHIPTQTRQTLEISSPP